jgi:tRNA(Ile)-lysidine synthase
LSDLAESAQKFYSLVCSSTEKIWPQLADCAADKVTLDLRSFLAQPPPVRAEIVRRSLAHLGSGERDLTHQHYERVLQLSQQKTGGSAVRRPAEKIELPNGFVVWCEYEKLILARRQESHAVEKYADKIVTLQVPGQTRFGRYFAESVISDAGYSMLDARRRIKSRIENRESKIEFIEWFDLDKIKLPIVVRFRRAGDKFWPLGLAGEKRIGKFLTAAKTPQQIREKALIVADAEKIIWLWPIRISEQAKVTVTTRKVLQLQITDTNPVD